jgi:hypothetical protein
LSDTSFFFSRCLRIYQMKSRCSVLVFILRTVFSVEFRRCLDLRSRMIEGMHQRRNLWASDPGVAKRRVACSRAPALIDS